MEHDPCESSGDTGLNFLSAVPAIPMNRRTPMPMPTEPRSSEFRAPQSHPGGLSAAFRSSSPDCRRMSGRVNTPSARPVAGLCRNRNS